MGREKIQIKVEITPAAKEALERICHERDMTQIGVISRVIEWFSKQDQLGQTLVLGLLPQELGAETLHKTFTDLARSLTGLKAEMDRLRAEGKLPPWVERVDISEAAKPRKTA